MISLLDLFVIHVFAIARFEMRLVSTLRGVQFYFALFTVALLIIVIGCISLPVLLVIDTLCLHFRNPFKGIVNLPH